MLLLHQLVLLTRVPTIISHPFEQLLCPFFTLFVMKSIREQALVNHLHTKWKIAGLT